MKTLVLFCCRCKVRKSFTGDNTNEIIKAIDDSGWVDLPDDDGECGPGLAPGWCPTCARAREEWNPGEPF